MKSRKLIVIPFVFGAILCTLWAIAMVTTFAETIKPHDGIVSKTCGSIGAMGFAATPLWAAWYFLKKAFG